MMTLDQVRGLALSLPEAAEEPHFERTSFRVRRKIFATALPDDEYLNIFVADDDRARALAAHPVFLEELVWGKQVCGLRVFLPEAEPEVVQALLIQAWTRKAPRQLLAQASDKGGRKRRPIG